METLSDQIARLTPEQRARLERLLDAKQRERAQATPAPITRAAREAANHPLSSAEQRLWFLEQFSNTGSAFNLHAALRIDGALDQDRLGAALDSLVDRHEVLRTRYVSIGGEPRRLLDETLRPRLAWLNLADDPARDARLNALIEEHAAQRFVLERGPLLALTAVRLADDANVVLLAVHHIIADAWSLALLLTDLWRGYSADAPALPPLDLQYLDFAHWQRRELDSARLQQQFDYWRRQLDGAPELLALPLDRPRPALQSYAGHELKFQVPRVLLDRVKARAREHGASLFMATLGAFQALLARFSGQHDIVIGTDVANRNHSATESMIGFFINQLPLRLRLAAGSTWAERLAEVRRTCLDAYAHQDVPFDALVDRLRLGRDASRTPLFQAKFMLQNTPDAEPADDGAPTMGLIERPETTSQFDLLLALKETAAGAHGSLRFRTELFDATTAERLLEHYLQLLGQLAEDPSARPLQHGWLSDDERARLATWNSTDCEVAFVTPLDALADQAHRTPRRVAICSGSVTIDYAELLDRVDRVAGWLSAQGIPVEQPVAVCLPRGPEMLIALLAVLRAGGCYVPLDVDYGEERLNYVLANCGARLVLSDGTLATPAAVKAVDIGRVLAEPQHAPERWPTPHPDQLAYLIYTSGSTGRPKGVAVRHGGLCNLLDSFRALTAINTEDRLLAVTTVAFDIAALELFLPLTIGATVVLATRDQAQDPRALLALLTDERITLLQATPSTWRGLVLAAGETLQLPIVGLCGGEALPRELAQQLMAAGVRLFNVYGPTETTIWSSYGAVTDAVLLDAAVAPLGAAIGNTTLHVLDGYGQPQPIGVPGELCIGGDGLARGYWNKPALTGAQFVPDPFSARPGARLYRTGDVVRRVADGRMLYLGRSDHQVKVRGYRIELGEIEAVLATHPDVTFAVVVTRSDALGATSLVAFVGTEGGVDRDALLAHAADFLPRYMLPHDLRVLEDVPLTPNGKIDRGALAARAQATVETHAGTPPSTEFERAVSLIWAAVLKLDETTLEQDFFRCGGHSLLAVQLLDRIERATGTAVPLQAFFRQPTLAGLVQALLAGDHGSMRYPLAQPNPAGADEPFPLTAIQQAYWLGRSGEFELGQIATQNYLEIDLLDLEVARFSNAWRRLVERHGMLRAVFLPDGRQRIAPAPPEHVPAVHDLHALPAPEAESFLLALRARMKAHRLPADTGPLFDLQFSRIDARRWRIHFCIDMLISDVISNQILFAELAQLYRDPRATLPPIALSFRDYVLAERTLAAGARHRRARDYWVARVDEFPARPDLPLAADPSRLIEQTFSRRRHSVPAPLWRAMRQQAGALRVSPTVLVLGAFGEVLACWSRQRRFAVNLTLFNRLPLHADVDRLVGDFTSSLLLELDYRDPAGFGTRLQAIQQQLWSDLDHRLFSGVEVIRELARARGGQHGAAMPVVFTSMLGLDADRRDGDDTDQVGDAADDRAEEGYSASQTSQVWLDHQVTEQDGALVLVWDALDAVFPDGLLDAMFEAYTARLHALATGDAEWNSPPLLVPSAQLATRETVNATAMALTDDTLHGLFEAQARNTPDGIALRHGGRTFRYGELLRYADALALRLVAAGVQSGDRVAIVMHKGWEQIVAALAIMKCGAAYMPVDAELPAQRRRQLIDDAVARVALVQTDLSATLSDAAEHVLAIDADLLERLPVGTPAVVARPNDIAYIIFTSGSTGRPKGVVIDHRGAVNTVLDINRRYGVGPHDRVLGLSSLSFDLSVWDMFGVFAAGGTLVLPTRAQLDMPAHWCSLVQDEGVTIWNSVPALMQIHVDHAEALPQPGLGPLRLVMMSGDWIPVTLPDRIRALAPAIDVISLGGATEASIWSIQHRIEGRTAALRSVPYGTPLANQTFAVLDDRMQPVPDWVTGQLYIGGIGLALGYWNDPARTAASFRAGADGGRLYRTGDLGRYLPDGTIEFLGREDTQVKVQGYRIELGDIEAALLAHPNVREAAVCALGGRDDGKTLVAYVVPRQTGTTDDIEITDPQARRLFKLEQRGRRQFEATLPRCAIDPDDALLEMLAALRAHRFDALALPKYAYPSAASLYPVQLYVHIGPGVHPTLAAGLHYFDPHQVALVQLSPDNPVEPNEAPSARIRLYWIADLDAIRPLYSSAETRRFCMLEAGYMHALLDAKDAPGLPSVGPLLPAARAVADPHLPENALLLGLADISADRTDHDVVNGPVHAPSPIAATDGVLPLPAVAPHTPDYGLPSRQSYRRYAARTCTRAQLSALLAPWAGMTGIDLVLHVAAADDDAARGWFRYDSAAHALAPLPAALPADTFVNADNAAFIAGAAFTLFVAATSPSDDDGTLIAIGRRGQQLMGRCTANGIGVCPIGAADETRLADALGLPAPWRVLHAFTGGPIDDAQRQRIEGDPPAVDTTPPDAELMAFLSERLPAYMLPRRYVVLSALPLSANGKVDRKALPTPDRLDAPPTGFVAPRNGLEQQIGMLWCALLGTEAVSVHDNFFNLGGNSLTAMQFTSRLRIQHGVELGLRQVFEHPTIAELADLAARTSTERAPSAPFDADDFTARRKAWENERPDGLLPPTMAQRFMFAQLQRGENNTAYHIPAALQIDGALDADRIESALQRCIDRHAALRTRFEYADGDLWQRVMPRLTLDVTRHDLRSLAAPARDAAIAELVLQHAHAPFDLFAGPLLRAKLLQCGDERHLLLLNVHHIVADYMSMDILVAELDAGYRGAHHELPALPLQYGDYALWERAYLETADAERQRAFWQQQLIDVPALQFAEHWDPGAADGWRSFRFDGPLLNAMRRRCRDSDTTMFMLTLSAVHALLSAATGQLDFAIGTPISTRRIPELEPCIGLLLNTLPIRLAAEPSANGATWLADVHHRCLQAFDHKDYPYEQLLLQRRADMPTDRPLPYRVRFVYRRIEANSQRDETLASREVEIDKRDAKFDLLISINEADDYVFGDFEFRGEVFATHEVELLCAQLPGVLGWFAANAERPLQSLFDQLAASRSEASVARSQRRYEKLRSLRARPGQTSDAAS